MEYRIILSRFTGIPARELHSILVRLFDNHFPKYSAGLKKLHDLPWYPEEGSWTQNIYWLSGQINHTRVQLDMTVLLPDTIAVAADLYEFEGDNDLVIKKHVAPEVEEAFREYLGSSLLVTEEEEPPSDLLSLLDSCCFWYLFDPI